MDAKQLQQMLLRAKSLQQKKQLHPAKAIYLQILHHYPQHPDVLHLLGILHNQLHQPDQAIHYLTQAIQFNPRVIQAYHNLALVYQDKGNLDKAMYYLEQALLFDPHYMKAIHKMANLYVKLGKFSTAREHYAKALSINANDAELWADYGNFYLQRNELLSAKECFQKALGFNSQLFLALVGMAIVSGYKNQYSEAIDYFQRALQQNPNDADIYAKLQRLYDEICLWDHRSQRLQKLLNLNRAAIKSHAKAPSDPFAILAYDWPAEDLAAIAQSHAQELIANNQFAKTQLNFVYSAKPSKRLKIGYLSCGFHNHPTAHLAYNLFASHDRNQFEIFAFSLSPNDGSDYYQHMATTCDKFIDIRQLSATQAAQTIYDHEINILIDMDAYIRGGCPDITALRPAPIQCHYLGFPGTTGATFIDYVIADHTVVTDKTAKTFTEKLIYLPNSYQINNNQQKIAAVKLTRQQYGLPEDGFVFCCFNHPYKIEPEIFSIWLEILRATPNAVLWLLSNSTLTENNLRKFAEKKGIAAERLVFAQREEKSIHLARYKLADLFLDTFYYNAHTTASDALWAGLPVLTCPNINFPSRVSASLLKAIELPELIMSNLAAYRDQAVYFYHHPAELKQLQQRLNKNIMTTALFDTAGFVKSLEQIYQTMWDTHARNNKSKSNGNIYENQH